MPVGSDFLLIPRPFCRMSVDFRAGLLVLGSCLGHNPRLNDCPQPRFWAKRTEETKLDSEDLGFEAFK